MVPLLKFLQLIVTVSVLGGCAAVFPPGKTPARSADFATRPESTRVAEALGKRSPFRSVIQQAQATGNNHVGLLEGGEDAFTARLHLIEQARHSIDLQTFIWVNDECGRLLARSLIEAAKRGVRVRVMVDYMGIEKDAQAMAQVTRAHPNLEVRVYRPTAGTLERGYLETLVYMIANFKGANQRMHNKVMVVDDAVAILGGRNVENSYFGQALSMNFKDRDVLVIGPEVKHMELSFEDYWHYKHSVAVDSLADVAVVDEPESATTEPPTAIDQYLRTLVRRSRNAIQVRNTLVRPMRPVASVEFISDAPGKNRDFFLKGGGRATARLVKALEEADQELLIQSPYLVLDRFDQRLFKRLRKAKPQLKIYVSTNSFGSTDNLIAYSGNVRLRDRYVHQLGFEISEYKPLPRDLKRVLPAYNRLIREWKRQHEHVDQDRPTFLCLHAKSFVVDEELAFVGSYNLDPRSAHLNTETGVLIRDRAFAKALKTEIARDLTPNNSWTIASRTTVDGVIDLHVLSQEVTDFSPVDVAPLDSTGAFELNPGMAPVPRDHPEFYHRYRDIGSFPGSDGILTERELKGRLLKLSTPVITPLL